MNSTMDLCMCVCTCVDACACVCTCVRVCACVCACILDALGVSTVCYTNCSGSGTFTITIGNICAWSSDTIDSFTVLHCCWCGKYML